MSLLDDIKKEESGMSLLDELKDAPEETREYTQSEQWRPDPGDEIEGVVVDRYSFDTEYSENVPGVVLRVDGDDTPWSVAGLHKVLREIIEEQDPQKGDRVAYIYSGKREGKNQPYHHYRGAIRRGNGSVKPVPAQRTEEPAQEKRKPGAARSASTQHEPTPRRKPGASKPAANSDEPDF